VNVNLYALNNTKFSNALAFVVWPLLALVKAMSNFRDPASKNIFWLFCAFYGYTFVVFDASFDSARYSKWFIQAANSSQSMTQVFASMYTVDEDASFDVFVPIVNVLLSRLTNDPRVLYMTFGLIFGFFYSRNLWFVLQFFKDKLPLQVISFVIGLALIIPIWEINGVRFWTATHIFIYGALKYLNTKNKVAVLISALSIFVHFSFLLPMGVFLVYIFLGNRLTVYFFLFLFTSLFVEIEVKVARDFLLANIPNIFQRKVETYLNPEYAESIDTVLKDANWYIKYYGKIIKYIVYVNVVAFFFLRRKSLEQGSMMKNILCFALLFYSICNVIYYLPSGFRFTTIANFFMFVFFCLYYYSDHALKVKRFVFALSSPALVVFIVIAFRIGSDFTSVLILVGNPFIAAFMEESIPIISLIK
jgi:hypothetical protein